MFCISIELFQYLNSCMKTPIGFPLNISTERILIYEMICTNSVFLISTAFRIISIKLSWDYVTAHTAAKCESLIGSLGFVQLLACAVLD